MLKPIQNVEAAYFVIPRSKLSLSRWAKSFLFTPVVIVAFHLPAVIGLLLIDISSDIHSQVIANVVFFIANVFMFSLLWDIWLLRAAVDANQWGFSNYFAAWLLVIVYWFPFFFATFAFLGFLSRRKLNGK